MGRLSINTSVRTSSEGDRYLAALEGRLDVASAPLLERTLGDICLAGAREIVVDLGSVEFMDSSGLNAILRCRMVCEEHGCDFSLTRARRSVRGAFEVARVLDRLPFHRPGSKRTARAGSPPQAGELEIRDDAQADRHTLVLAGQLDSTNSAALERVMVALCKSGASEITLDLRQLDLLDSAGVRAIVAGQARCREHGCKFFLTPGRQAVERLFDVIGLRRDPPAPETRPSSAI